MKKTEKIQIKSYDLDMASVIRQNSRENIYAFLKRMGQDAEADWDKDVLAMLLKDIVIENPEYILQIYDKKILEFLFLLWESEEMELEQNEWTMIGQLKLLGFVDYIFVEDWRSKTHSLFVVKEAKDIFYYYLKSRTARMLMDKYLRWESLIKGMMIHYGIISFQRLYYYFCRITRSPIDDREMHRFLSVRMDMLSFGGFAMERSTSVEYYQNYEISNPENVLEKRQKQKEIDYFTPKEEQLLTLAENNGIGEWDGISSLAEVFLQLLDMEYYKTIIAMKSCILMIQNDESLPEIETYLLGSYPECRTYQEQIRKGLHCLYDSVPVFSLKGWCRKDLKKKQRKDTIFTVIKGGKKDPLI